MVELMAKAEDRTPYTVVALQEADRMNGLTNEIKISLKELDLGLKVCLLIFFFIFRCQDYQRRGIVMHYSYHPIIHNLKSLNICYRVN